MPTRARSRRDEPAAAEDTVMEDATTAEEQGQDEAEEAQEGEDEQMEEEEGDEDEEEEDEPIRVKLVSLKQCMLAHRLILT